MVIVILLLIFFPAHEIFWVTPCERTVIIKIESDSVKLLKRDENPNKKRANSVGTEEIKDRKRLK
jgi:hypothetical protein